MGTKDVEGMANSVDPDHQTAPEGAVHVIWFCTVCLDPYVQKIWIIVVPLYLRSDFRGEEQKIRTANDRALQEMRMRLERELEEAKLELLEVYYKVTFFFAKVFPILKSLCVSKIIHKNVKFYYCKIIQKLWNLSKLKLNGCKIWLVTVFT